MSSESRPRRTIRAASKVPVELTSTKSSASSVGASSASRITSGVATALENGNKRSALSENEDETESSGKAGALAEQKEVSGKTKNKTGKNRTINSKESAEERLYDINFILTNPKSPLVNLDICGIINYGTWTALSPESREKLCKLLPDIAFGEQVQELDSLHPSRRYLESHPSDTQMTESQEKERYNDNMPMDVDESIPRNRSLARSPEPSFFRDPHFESAARTFQDHLYTGWFTSAHHETVERHLSGVRDGSLHAPWKDEAWDREHPEEPDESADADGMTNEPSNSLGAGSDKRRRKERASEFDILVRKGFLKQGDIITLKHKFTAFGVTVEKDALISAIHPKTSVLTLTSSSSTTRDLPPALLPAIPSVPADLPSLREMTVTCGAHLITALLDIDGRIPRTQRPRLDTWKILSVWQWPADGDLQPASPEEAMLLERGGRERLGTLFYLRGQALDD